MNKKIVISLVSNKLVFSENFPSIDIIEKEWEFISETVNRNNLERLYVESIAQKGGWSELDVEESPSSIEAKLSPTFFVNSIMESIIDEEKTFLQEIAEQVDFYVHKHRNPSSVQTVKPNHTLKDAQLFTFSELGSSESLQFSNLIDQLKEKNIEFQIEYEHSNAAEVGASGGVFEALIFIKDSLASGMVYEIAKKIPSLKPTYFKKDQTELLLEKAAHFLSTQPENLELTYFDRNEGTIALIVRFNRSKYNFAFTTQNEIIHFEKVSPS